MAGIYRLKTYTNILWVLQLVSNLAHNSAKYPYFSESGAYFDVVFSANITDLDILPMKYKFLFSCYIY